MELEERLYSKILLKCSDIQILFCNKKDDWGEAKRENDTEMHLISKTNFQSIFAVAVVDIKTLPRWLMINIIKNVRISLFVIFPTSYSNINRIIILKKWKIPYW